MPGNKSHKASLVQNWLYSILEVKALLRCNVATCSGLSYETLTVEVKKRMESFFVMQTDLQVIPLEYYLNPRAIQTETDMWEYVIEVSLSSQPTSAQTPILDNRS